MLEWICSSGLSAWVSTSLAITFWVCFPSRHGLHMPIMSWEVLPIIAIPFTIPFQTIQRTKLMVMYLSWWCHMLTLALETFVQATRSIVSASVLEGALLLGGVFPAIEIYTVLLTIVLQLMMYRFDSQCPSQMRSPVQSQISHLVSVNWTQAPHLASWGTNRRFLWRLGTCSTFCKITGFHLLLACILVEMQLAPRARMYVLSLSQTFVGSLNSW